jgi:hypothetical protein
VFASHGERGGRHFIPTHDTDSRVGSYLATYGRQSWEVDALDPTTLAGVVGDEIDNWRDQDRWDEVVEQEEWNGNYSRWLPDSGRRSPPSYAVMRSPNS